MVLVDYWLTGHPAGLGSNTYLYLQIQIQIQIRRICICICIWSNFKPCICIWSTVFGVFDKFVFKYNTPPGWRGIVVTVRAGGRAVGRAGGCQTCGTHISVTAWWIFSVRSSMELSRPVVVHCYAHLPICPVWACPWAKNLSNLPQIGSRLCGSHISETAGWIYPI